MSEKMIKGYKGFNKGLVCRDKQYAENTVFNEDEATLCERGMHFCENPLKVLKYYPYYNSDTKSFSEYAEVEAPENVTESDGGKSVTKQLKIGSKISFDELIKAGVEFNLSKAKFDKEKSVATGWCSGVSAVGDYSGAIATGDCSGASTTGDYSGASVTGRCGGAMVVGDNSQAMCKNNSVAVAVGKGSMAKGEIGCYIVLTEVKWDFETDTNKIIDYKCFKVDGEIIKADTCYTLVDGKPVEVE